MNTGCQSNSKRGQPNHSRMHGTRLALCSKFQILDCASVLDKAKRLANKKLFLKGKTDESTKADMKRTTDKVK